MATVSKQIFGAAIAVVSVATPASAQHASQSDPLISAHHRQHLRVSSPPSGSPAFTSPLETLGVGWVIQRAGRIIMIQNGVVGRDR
jgi:hypothetical protein